MRSRHHPNGRMMMDAIVRSLREKCVTTPLKGERERKDFAVAVLRCNIRPSVSKSVLTRTQSARGVSLCHTISPLKKAKKILPPPQKRPSCPEKLFFYVVVLLQRHVSSPGEIGNKRRCCSSPSLLSFLISRD